MNNTTAKTLIALILTTGLLSIVAVVGGVVLFLDRANQIQQSRAASAADTCRLFQTLAAPALHAHPQRTLAAMERLHFDDAKGKPDCVHFGQTATRLR